MLLYQCTVLFWIFCVNIIILFWKSQSLDAMSHPVLSQSFPLEMNWYCNIVPSSPETIHVTLFSIHVFHASYMLPGQWSYSLTLYLKWSTSSLVMPTKCNCCYLYLVWYMTTVETQTKMSKSNKSLYLYHLFCLVDRSTHRYYRHRKGWYFCSTSNYIFDFHDL